MRNKRIKNIIGSKYECITCRKRFKEIANFLVHRTLHEAPHLQNGGGNNNLSIESIRKNDSSIRDSMEIANALESSETDNLGSPEVERSERDEFDPVVDIQPKHENYHIPSSQKALQPKGARKRKGGLQQQCKLLACCIISSPIIITILFGFLSSLFIVNA